MICAVPVGNLKPKDLFLLGSEGMETIVGCVERIPEARGYAQVVYIKGKGKHHEFFDKDGKGHEFDDSGFRRAEWSAGTLVRPLISEGDMADNVANALVDDGGPTVGDIKAKVEKMRARAAAIKAPVAAKSAKGNPLPAKVAPKATKVKAEKAPRVMSACRCGCGGQTGGTFCPGHDARYFGWLKKVSGGTMEFKELPKHLQKEFVDVKGVKKALVASNH